MSFRTAAFADLLAKYGRVLRASWAARHEFEPPRRSPLERQFLPATLELQETPPPALPRAIMLTLVFAFVVAVVWSIIGRVETVAVAQGKIIPSGRAKVIQPAETAVVKRIVVADGEDVKAGDLLIELDATISAADAERSKEEWLAARLEAARAAAFLSAVARDSSESVPPPTEEPSLQRIPESAPDSSPRRALESTPDSSSQPKLGSTLDSSPRRKPGSRDSLSDLPVPGASTAMIATESRLLASQVQEFRSRLAALDAEAAKRQAELQSTRELVAKLQQTVPIARRRAEDYKNLVQQNYVSQHGYLEREQARIEQERDLAFQQSRERELALAVEESAQRRAAFIAETKRAATDSLSAAEKKAALYAQDMIKTEQRKKLMQLTAPVAGTVQQLAIHTVGGVVTPAQPLMVVVPKDYSAEVEAVLENKDVGFVKTNQQAEVKIETFPFTRYGTVPAKVTFVSQDAVQDEKRGLIFPARLLLEHATLQVDERLVTLAPGMAITAEIKTGERRVIEYFLEPLMRTASESLREK
jgi:hemolysin D